MRSKIVNRERAAQLSASYKAAGKKVGYTSGVFDILHPGHVEYLGNYSPDFKSDAAILSLNELVLADPFSCHRRLWGRQEKRSEKTDKI
jgi:bifunctional ADP-heptose synthase (sugar kinase/adenylyltransferase)